MPLCHIINCTLLTDVVPSMHQIAKVVSIYKYGKHDDPYHYRPVSVLPSISKILEKLIARRLFSFFKVTFRMNINLDLHQVEI